MPLVGGLCLDHGALPRFGVMAFRGHVLRHRDIPLARAIAVSQWLSGPDCAFPCFGFIGFRCFFVKGQLSGFRVWVFRVVGCRVALEIGFRGVCGGIRSGRAQEPHTSPTTPSPAPKKIYTWRVKHKHGAWCLEREEVPKQW